MIEYAKIILPKVCFWEHLFRKELIKSLKWIEPEEVDDLYDWCCNQFFDTHQHVLADVFNQNILK